MKKKSIFKKILIAAVVLIAAAVGINALYISLHNANSEKYLGHGFKYMNGYSSTDFTGYHVYDSEKLYKLDHKASLIIENEEDMPVLDGAEACYPVYSALALATYKDIGQIEKKYHDEADKASKSSSFSEEDDLRDVFLQNGKYVTFTNSSEAYYRLIHGEADIVFAARPSSDQKEYASSVMESIITTPVGREAFIFFVEEDNPVDGLTSDQIRAIFHGDITNWKEVGGKDEKIVTFQRPENSGSQVCMRYFMGDVELADPKTVDVINVGPMGGVVSEVAQYSNEAGAIGYTFKYFLTGLNQEEHVKILSVDGVYPDTDNIKNGSYPVTVSLVAATLASNNKPYVSKMMDYILSDEGQEIIENTGYAPLSSKMDPVIENTFTEITPIKLEADIKDHVSYINFWPDEGGVNGFMEFVYDNTRIKGYLLESYKTDVYPENSMILHSLDYDTVLIFIHKNDSDTWTFSAIEINRHSKTLPPLNTVYKQTSGN